MVTKEHARQLGRVVRVLRAARGLSQADVARGIGVSRSYVAQIESGRIANPGWVEISALADLFGMNLHELGELVAEYEQQFAPYLRGKADAFRGVDAPAA